MVLIKHWDRAFSGDTYGNHVPDAGNLIDVVGDNAPGIPAHLLRTILFPNFHVRVGTVGQPALIGWWNFVELYIVAWYETAFIPSFPTFPGVDERTVLVGKLHPVMTPQAPSAAPTNGYSVAFTGPLEGFQSHSQRKPPAVFDQIRLGVGYYISDGLAVMNSGDYTITSDSAFLAETLWGV